MVLRDDVEVAFRVQLTLKNAITVVMAFFIEVVTSYVDVIIVQPQL